MLHATMSAAAEERGVMRSVVPVAEQLRQATNNVEILRDFLKQVLQRRKISSIHKLLHVRKQFFAHTTFATSSLENIAVTTLC